MQRKPSPLSFPTKGVVENAPFSQQPPGTTPEAMNVRSYDSIARKNRGGQRLGMMKISEDQINGTNPIQNLSQVVEAVDLVQNAGWGEQYAEPDLGINTAEGSYVLPNPDGDRVAYTQAGGDSSVLAVFSISGSTISSLGSSHEIDLGARSVQRIAWNSDGSVLFIGADLGSSTDLFAYPYDKTSGFGSVLDTLDLNSSTINGVVVTRDDNAVVAYGTGTPPLEAWAWDGSSFGSKYSDPPDSWGNNSFYPSRSRGLLLHPTEDILFAKARSDDIEAVEFSSSSGFGSRYSPFTNTENGGIGINPTGTFIVVGDSLGAIDIIAFDASSGFGAKQDETPGAASNPTFSPDGNFLLLGDHTGSGGGSPGIWNFSNGLGSKLTTPSSFSNEGAFSGAWLPSGQATLWANGSGGTANDGLIGFEFIQAGVNPSARETRVVAVSAGSVYRSDVTFDNFQQVSGGSLAFSPSAPLIDAAESFQKLFFCDGLSANYQYLDFSDNTLKDWASDVTAGSLPAGTDDTSLGCRIIANYRGRIVLSGLKEEPQNWFMSKAGDPLDFDYSPTTPNATQAVAGNNSDVGELGDIVTALAPYQDDLMVIGGANSVWLMRGDPAAGGQIDNIVRGIGIVGPDAWCFDSSGNFYFFGVNGLYRISAGLGSQPEMVSEDRLDKTFAEINISDNAVILEYDPTWHGVHIFVVAGEEPTSDDAAPMHYFWDSRNNAFWPDQYPASMGPTATLYLTADDPRQSGVLLGGWDGYIRQFDDNAKNDDGVAILSRVMFTPMNEGLALADSKLSEIHINLDRVSDDLSLNVYAGANVEDAVQDDNLRFTRTLVGGRNNAIRQRVRGSGIVVELEQTASDATWAYESGIAIFETRGKTRRRRL